MSQNKESNQNSQEFKIPRDIDITFFRLLPPHINTLNIPLNGLYNDIDNREEDSENPLQNKFSNFDMTSSTSVNNENLFSITSLFGKVFHKEKLEGLILFTNTSDHEVFLKNLEVILTIEEKPETKTKKQIKLLDIRLPKNGVNLNKKEVYSVKFTKILDYVSKYSIFIDLKVRSSVYDTQYILAKQRNMIKELGNDFDVIGDNVIEVSNCKK